MKKGKNMLINKGSNVTLSILLIALLAFVWSTQYSNALTCRCNVCPNNETECVVNQPESTCYKSVIKSEEDLDGEAVKQYGCFGRGENSFDHMQCRVQQQSFTTPTYIACCKNEDYCNEDLPDPTIENDPRWAPEIKNNLYNEWSPYAPLLIFISIVLMIIIVPKFPRCCSRNISHSKGSTCSIETDIEKHFIQHPTSGSASTQSYSVSGDPCHKPDPNNEDSFLVADMTSGLGDMLLNQRTMAAAIGFGQTDHVGSGRFGRVFRGQFHGEDVAVKAFRTIDTESWRREDTIFRLLNHENIVRSIASEVTSLGNGNTEIWMFLEFCPYGSLSDFLDHNEILGPQQAVKILYSIINGLNYLHENYAQTSRLYKPSIAHRDIKSKNILMKTPEICCIADFGHALIRHDEDNLDYGKYQQLQVGTVRYMAPEILKPLPTLNYTIFSTFAQADLYQFGLVLWEVCYRTSLDIIHPAGHHKLPYDGVVPQNPDIQDMIKIVCEDQYRPPTYEKWEKYPLMKRLTDLMIECWRPNPKARMETLGVKKKLKEMFEGIVAPLHSHPQQLSLHINSLSPQRTGTTSDRDRTRTFDITM